MVWTSSGSRRKHRTGAKRIAEVVVWIVEGRVEQHVIWRSNRYTQGRSRWRATRRGFMLDVRDVVRD
jgi:hypothetical protein